MIEHAVNKINEADLVLAGMGEELDQLKKIRKSERYAAVSSMTKNLWILSFVEKLMLEELKEEKFQIYENLSAILKSKNYFVISTCQDGLIQYGALDKKHIVEPCGSYCKLQCSEGCSAQLYDNSEEFLEQVKEFVNGERKEAELIQPLCPVCGKPLVFNNINAENYNESGYLEQWNIYKKWLQGTVNKNLCILELGVGLEYPTVIRWPFEKIAFFNQKAELFRVHSRLYQLSGEIKDRGYGICQRPEEFIRELSNAF